jgi:uncharacterized membrane protein YkoI
MNRKQLISAVLLAAGVATAGGLVYAKQEAPGQNDAVTDLGKAKISLSQAIGSAEAQAGGKATKAELEGERGVVVFNVEVVTADNKVFDVKVDAADGKVLSSKADAADRGGKDEEDEKD